MTLLLIIDALQVFGIIIIIIKSGMRKTLSVVTWKLEHQQKQIYFDEDFLEADKCHENLDSITRNVILSRCVYSGTSYLSCCSGVNELNDTVENRELVDKFGTFMCKGNLPTFSLHFFSNLPKQ